MERRGEKEEEEGNSLRERGKLGFSVPISPCPPPLRLHLFENFLS